MVQVVEHLPHKLEALEELTLSNLSLSLLYPGLHLLSPIQPSGMGLDEW
jgi:hypothetical protein